MVVCYICFGGLSKICYDFTPTVYLLDMLHIEKQRMKAENIQLYNEPPNEPARDNVEVDLSHTLTQNKQMTAEAKQLEMQG